MKLKLTVLIVSGIVIVLGVGGYAYLKNIQDNKLPDNLNKQFGCDRITLDSRYTDKYCKNYKLYKLDHAAGKI